MFCAIKLSKSDPTPLYIQLGNELAKLIQTAILPSGTKLPTIRSLSRKLKINRDTVVSAYKLLETQGLIIPHVGSGTYVAPLAHSPCTSESTNITCSSLSFPKDLFPPSMAINLANSVLEREGWSCFSDPLYRERSLIKQVVCDFLKSVGIAPSPAEVRIIKDSFSFFSMLSRLSPRNSFCIEQYCDLSYSAFLRSLGIRVYEIPLLIDGMDLETLERHLKHHNISYIWISTYIQNPTGICYSETNKRALLELASKYDCYIIEDGTLNDFVYHQPLLTPIYSLNSNERTIFFYNFTKLYLPQLNYTFFVLPNTLIKKLPDALECTFNEHLLCEYLESDYFYTLRQNLILENFHKYDILISKLHNLSSRFKIYYDKGGLFAWIECLSCDMEEVCEHLASHHIIVAPGTLFTTENSSTYFRVSLSNLTAQDIPKIIDILKQ